MRKFIVGMLVGALAFGAVDALAGKKKPRPRFGVERVQGVEPAVDVVSGIADPHKLGFDVVAPPDEHLGLDWVLTCSMPDGSVISDPGSFEDDSGPQGEVSVSFNQDIYGDADACSLDVDAVSDGIGVLKVTLRGAGDLPVVPVPEPSPSI